jgi:hypothetical protein
MLCGCPWAHGDPQATPALKAPLAGLVDMGDIAFHNRDGGEAHTHVSDLTAYAGSFGGIVINLGWDQLEPTRGTLNTGELDRVLADIRAYNQAHPEHPIGARLRIWPGPTAPVWAKHLEGDPVEILHRGKPITVGHFWSAPYRQAWRDLQTRLADRYDREPLIREVSNSSGSTITDEPFILAGDAQSIAHLLAAGYQDKLFEACLAESSADYAGWKTTRVECPFNPFRLMDTGRPQDDTAFTLAQMQAWRRLGPRGIIGNHSLQQPLAPQLAPIYDEMMKLGPPIALQTHAPRDIDLEGALQNGIRHGAGSIEIWSEAKVGGFKSFPPEKLRELAALFH